MLKQVIALKTQGEEMSTYDAKLFSAVNTVRGKIDTLSFKEATSIIGSSLRDDFSELDPTET